MNTIRMRVVATFVTLVALAYLCGVLFTPLMRESISKHQMYTWLFGIGIGLLLLTAFVGYLLVQTIRRRLYDLEEAAVLIADGRLHHRVVSFGGQDEIDHLAIQFNRMGERLEQQVALLQKMAAENASLAQSAERAATMEERQRVARELHDSVSQQLFSLTLLAAAARNQSQQDSPRLADTVTQIEKLANQAQREMRALLLHLRPIELEGRSLLEAAPDFLQAVAERHGLAWTFAHHGDETVPQSIEEPLFRILQESVANVLKHADATSVMVQLLVQTSRYELIIADDGCGFDSQAQMAGDTYGMTAMRERALLLGGRLEFLPRNPGMTVRVIIPRASAVDHHDA
jgi:NarL family two-component system sensor histidine kinase LiaS